MSESSVLSDPGTTPSSVALPDLTTLPEADRQSALERFRLLQPHLEEGRPLTLVARESLVIGQT